jgi:hypothetical protein
MPLSHDIFNDFNDDPLVPRGSIDVWGLGVVRQSDIKQRRLQTPEEKKKTDETEKKESEGLVYVCGCDVGIKRDPSSVAIYRVIEHGEDVILYLEHCKSLRLGLSFRTIEGYISKLDSQLRKHTTTPEITWVIDSTGIGMNLVESVERQLTKSDVVGAMITGGQNCRMEAGTLYISKSFLASSLLGAFESERIIIPKNLKGLDSLLDELYAFEAKIDAETQNESFSGSGSTHDDKVIACALGCVYAQNFGRLMVY